MNMTNNTTGMVGADDLFWTEPEEGAADEQRVLAWIRVCVERAHDAALRGSAREAEGLLARARELADATLLMPTSQASGDELFDLGATLVRRALMTTGA